MDLNLAIRPGRPAEELTATVVRELTPSDLALLAEGGRGSASQKIKKLRDSHHALARALAGGMSNPEASLATGYDLGYISILKSDPTFQELVAFYRANLDIAMSSLHDKLSTISKVAADELRDRLEEKPDEIGTTHLIEIVKMGADRTGHGPKSTQVNINVDLAERLSAARKRASESARVIEHQEVEPCASAIDEEPPTPILPVLEAAE